MKIAQKFPVNRLGVTLLAVKLSATEAL